MLHFLFLIYRTTKLYNELVMSNHISLRCAICEECDIKAATIFFPFAFPCIHETVTSSPHQSTALYLAAHTPAVPHYSVNALAELNLARLNASNGLSLYFS